ncbi:hypothetical protein HMPREF3038_02216 [Akkermansia sp. KLE1797]|nr:hypothetical protein HMPREF3038_02216 [Akkermansia sp. KLE1797]KXU55227.1 hypothetical protein HMPREF3039_00563 [Akkermansia sp. KLE1798]KZA05396.1 hypothetical protein HMPREF1326_00925 [Akkermansia sp. KLE1605]
MKLLNIHFHNSFLFYQIFLSLFSTFLKCFASKIFVDSGLQIRLLKIVLIFNEMRTFPEKDGFVFWVVNLKVRLKCFN